MNGDYDGGTTGWRFPTPKQQKAEETARRLTEAQRQRAAVDDHESWWDAVLRDPRARNPRPDRTKQLGEITRELLRVECLRRFRIVEIKRDDAIRLYGASSIWKEVADLLLADGCQHRTGRHEEDGCWPDVR